MPTATARFLMPDLPLMLSRFTGSPYTWSDVGVLFTLIAGFPPMIWIIWKYAD